MLPRTGVLRHVLKQPTVTPTVTATLTATFTVTVPLKGLTAQIALVCRRTLLCFVGLAANCQQPSPLV